MIAPGRSPPTIRAATPPDRCSRYRARAPSSRRDRIPRLTSAGWTKEILQAGRRPEMTGSHRVPIDLRSQFVAADRPRNWRSGVRKCGSPISWPPARIFAISSGNRSARSSDVKKVALGLEALEQLQHSRRVRSASGPSSIVSQTSRRGVSKCVTTGPHHGQFATSVG